MVLVNHKILANEIHADNVAAGWWTNISTGAPLDRNFGEMIALVHSELSECWRGIALRSNDDHLPKLPMYQVEIADACIRVYDILGGMFADLPSFIEMRVDVPEGFLTPEDRLVFLHLLISEALECFRKSNRFDCKAYLHRFLDACFEWAEEKGFDLFAIIDEKREYNRSRADHKIENRLLADGKKI